MRALGVAAATLLAAATALAEGGRPPRPPKEAFEACAGRDEGAACTVTPPGREALSGTCRATPDAKRVCVPAGMPPPPQGGQDAPPREP